MKDYKYILVKGMLFLIIASCSSHSNNPCSKRNGQMLELTPVRSRLYLPQFVVLNTIRYGEDAIFGRKIKSQDSTWVGFIYVASYKNRVDAMPTLADRMSEYKFSFGGDSVQLILKQTKFVNGLEVGFLKHFNFSKGRLESRIIFYRNFDYTYIQILENSSEKDSKKKSTADCAFELITFDE